VSNTPISPEQLAVLVERVKTQSDNHAELKGLILGLGASQQTLVTSVAVFTERLERTEDGKKRLFEKVEAQDKRMDDMEKTVTVHAWTWKLIASLASLALALGGWTFNEFKAIHDGAASREKRLSLLEFIVGGRSYQQPPPQSGNQK
jgi:hypothetical protein